MFKKNNTTNLNNVLIVIQIFNIFWTIIDNIKLI